MIAGLLERLAFRKHIFTSGLLRIGLCVLLVFLSHILSD